MTIVEILWSRNNPDTSCITRAWSFHQSTHHKAHHTHPRVVSDVAAQFTDVGEKFFYFLKSRHLNEHSAARRSAYICESKAHLISHHHRVWVSFMINHLNSMLGELIAFCVLFALIPLQLYITSTTAPKACLRHMFHSIHRIVHILLFLNLYHFSESFSICQVGRNQSRQHKDWSHRHYDLNQTLKQLNHVAINPLSKMALFQCTHFCADKLAYPRTCRSIAHLVTATALLPRPYRTCTYTQQGIHPAYRTIQMWRKWLRWRHCAGCITTGRTWPARSTSSPSSNTPSPPAACSILHTVWWCIVVFDWCTTSSFISHIRSFSF